MRRYLPYILGAVILGGIILLLATASGGDDTNDHPPLDETITLRRTDKIPYGTYVAYNSLGHLFPHAKVHNNSYQPGLWDSVSVFGKGQAFICICDRFTPDEYELKRLIAFAESGNDVFISARYFSATADRLLKCTTSSVAPMYENNYKSTTDSLGVILNNPLFGKTKRYVYPGKGFRSYISETDTDIAEILGYDDEFHPNFIRQHAGKGNFYIHTEPLAFCNYFVLHKSNRDYFEKAFSVIQPGTSNIIWDEYFLTRNNYTSDNDNSDYFSHRKKNNDWFAALMNMKNSAGNRSFRAAVLTLVFLLLVFVLMKMRRNQRMIPVIKSPANESLDFVKTIGRLYFDKSDHKNLCRKMSAYFLEHVRNRYKLVTGELDENFIRQLLFKSGAKENIVRDIVAFIRHLDNTPAISEEQLIGFYSALEVFYATT